MTPRSDTPPSADLHGYELLLCVCGGIAVYKVCTVVSTLVQGGCGVSVAMTDAGTKLVGPPTFQALSGRRVLTDLWQPDQAQEIQHIALTDAADLVLVAPATANTIGKVAAGIADDAVSTLVISAASPVWIAPAMNDRMWSNPVVQRNCADLQERGFRFVGPGEGWLACRSAGPGRMAEPEEIVDGVVAALREHPPKRSAPDRE